MSGLGGFFGLGDAYETSLIQIIDSNETDDAEIGPDGTDDAQEAAPPVVRTAAQRQQDYQEYKLALKTKTMNYLRFRIYGYDSHPSFPHISKAFLDAKEISEISLQVRRLNLSLCKIQKVWPFRSNNRGQSYQNVTRAKLQRDGPISMLYRLVVSFEIMQCFEKPPSELAQRIRNLHGEDHLNHCCRVFLYGSYARRITEFLSKMREGNATYCSLRHIPPQCIHRYKANDWVDAKEKYCITIGDESLAAQGDTKTRFDSEDLIVELIRVDKNDKVLSEYQIRKLDDGDVVLECVEGSRLVSVFNAFKVKDAPQADTPDNGDPPLDAEDATNEAETQKLGPRCVKLGELPALFDASERLKASGGPLPWQKVDVFALALSFTQPYRTKRGDLTMSVAIIDDSLAIPDGEDTANDAFIKSHNVIMFVDSKMGKLLPKLRRSGDVLYMKNLELNRFNGEIQLVGQKRGDASYICYRQEIGNNSSGASPTTVVDTDRLTPAEKDRLRELWVWGQKRLRLHPTMKQEHRFRVRDMLAQQSTQTDSFGSAIAANQGDLFAMITAIIPWEENHIPPPHPKGFLRVWDGTGESLSDKLPLQSAVALEAVKDGDPPEKVVIGVAQLVQQIRESNSDSDLKSPGALAGRVVNVAIWETQHWKLFEDGHLKIGLFIRLRNVVESMMPRLGVRCLHVQSKSSFTITPPLTFEVIKLIEEHHQRILNEEATNPSSAVLPLGMEENGSVPRRPAVTLRSPAVQRLLKGSSLQMELLHKFAAAPHGAIFYGTVQITSIFPPIQQALDDSFEKTYCRKTNGCSSKPYFQFALRIEQEGSASVLDAIVCDKGREKPIGQLLFLGSAESSIENPKLALERIQETLVRTPSWRVLLNSTIVNGKKFFLLTNLSRQSEP